MNLRDTIEAVKSLTTTVSTIGVGFASLKQAYIDHYSKFHLEDPGFERRIARLEERLNKIDPQPPIMAAQGEVKEAAPQPPKPPENILVFEGKPFPTILKNKSPAPILTGHDATAPHIDISESDRQRLLGSLNQQDQSKDATC